MVLWGAGSNLRVVETLLDLALRAAERYPEGGFESGGSRLSYARLDREARRLAAGLGLPPGERVLLLHADGLEFIRAFWGCVYAGLVPVPAPVPQPSRLARTLPRLRRIASDCQAAGYLAEGDFDLDLARLRPGEGEDWSPPSPTGPALLQYTSGSTREPRGVMVSHANLLHNLEMLGQFLGHRPRMVHWLPLHHDMGLIRGMLSPLYLGGDCRLLDPLDFLQRPRRWLQAITEFGATVTGAPDFGYALAARKVKDTRGLDLSSLRVAFCSAEPIRRTSYDEFCQRFGVCGFAAEAFKPAYGLAEATVMVSGELGPPKFLSLDRIALGQRRIAAGADLQVAGCGQPLGGQEVVIVEDGRGCQADGVGEIWVRGPSVAQGYWGRPDDPTFAGYLEDGRGPYLRTGDLGWLSPSGDLYVTGRLKDVLIVRGQNYYPQDLEAVLEENLPQLRPGCTVAFEVDGQVIVCAEVEDGRPDELVNAIWCLLGEHFGLSAREVLLLARGATLKTSSGKVRRAQTREDYLQDTLNTWHRWRAPGLENPLA